MWGDKDVNIDAPVLMGVGAQHVNVSCKVRVVKIAEGVFTAQHMTKTDSNWNINQWLTIATKSTLEEARQVAEEFKTKTLNTNVVVWES